MKGRKKIQKTESLSKQQQIRTYTMNDGGKFQLDYDSFRRVSPFVKSLEPEGATFAKIDTPTFNYIMKYIELRKDNPQYKSLQIPLQGTFLSALINEVDAQFVEQIRLQGWATLEKVLDAASYLEIDYLKEILLGCIAIEIINKDNETLKTQLGIKEPGVEEAEETEEESQRMKEEMKAIIKHLSK